jgi:Right handed beta helix region
VLDSAGYGTVTINKAVSVIAPPGIYAGITVTAGAGIDVTAGAVTLRGLTIRGLGGQVGIHVGAAQVRIDRCAISGLGLYGIHADAANAEVHVRDTQIAQCAEGLRFDGAIRFSLERVRTEANTSVGLNALNGAWGSARELVSVRNANYGVGLTAQPAGVTCYLALDAAVVNDNGAAGISAGVAAAAVASRVLLTVTRSMIAGNGADGIAVSTQGAGTASATVAACAIDVNTLRGVAAMGNGATAAVCGNQITRNGGLAWPRLAVPSSSRKATTCSTATMAEALRRAGR